MTERKNRYNERCSCRNFHIAFSYFFGGKEKWRSAIAPDFIIFLPLRLSLYISFLLLFSSFKSRPNIIKKYIMRACIISDFLKVFRESSIKRRVIFVITKILTKCGRLCRRCSICVVDVIMFFLLLSLL